MAACPACPHRALSREQSLARKLDRIREVLAPWASSLAGIESVEEPSRWHYRRSVRLAALHRDGRWQFGLHRDDDVLPIPDCPVHAPDVNRAAALLGGVLPAPDAFPLAWYVQSGAQATLVARSCDDATRLRLEEGTLALAAAAKIEGLWLHVHPSTGKRVTTHRGWELLWGEPRSRDASGLLHGPTSFRQAIPSLHAAALDAAEEFLAPTAGDAVLDLYSGTGSSLRRWRARGASTIGVELGAESIECTARNVPETRVLQGRCEDRLPQLSEWLLQGGNPPESRLLYLNPPRTGLEQQVLTWIVGDALPTRLAYLSCSAHTLARDLHALTAAGYSVRGLRAFDFLPQTRHAESLALLERDAHGTTGPS